MRAQRADELYELKNTDIFYDTSKTNFEERELHEYVRMLKKKRAEMTYIISTFSDKQEHAPRRD